MNRQKLTFGIAACAAIALLASWLAFRQAMKLLAVFVGFFEEKGL